MPASVGDEGLCEAVAVPDLDGHQQPSRVRKGRLRVGTGQIGRVHSKYVAVGLKADTIRLSVLVGRTRIKSLGASDFVTIGV